jgi:hypothetical protein
LGSIKAAERIAAALQLQLQRYAAAPAEHCCELHTDRRGAKIPTSHWMMLFCRNFGALVPSEWQGCHHQGGQRDEARGFRASATARPRVAAGQISARVNLKSRIPYEVSTVFFPLKTFFYLVRIRRNVEVRSAARCLHKTISLFLKSYGGSYGEFSEPGFPHNFTKNDRQDLKMGYIDASRRQLQSVTSRLMGYRLNNNNC